jgi:hypothetical protein
MLPLVAVWLLGWEDPAALVRGLSDDAVQVREHAAEELYRRGEEVRGHLIDAHEATTDPEARARLIDIVRRLDADERIRDFGGGPKVAGFGAALRSDRFFGSGPFRLTLDIMNLEKVDRELAVITSWDLELPDQETKGNGSQAQVQLKKLIGTTGVRRATGKRGDGRTEAPMLLRPGEFARFEFSLEVKAVPAGDYDVAVEYFARALIPGAEVNLRTNSVRLMIRN